MRPIIAFGASLLAISSGCSWNRPKTLPTAPAGIVEFHFSRKIQGPVEMTLNGSRIPVEQGPKGGMRLVVQGLKPGTYKYLLSSPRDAFGPDLGEMVLPSDKGLVIFTLAQRFEAVLYGKPQPLPPGDGLPGVKAVLHEK